MCFLSESRSKNLRQEVQGSSQKQDDSAFNNSARIPRSLRPLFRTHKYSICLYTHQIELTLHRCARQRYIDIGNMLQAKFSCIFTLFFFFTESYNCVITHGHGQFYLPMLNDCISATKKVQLFFFLTRYYFGLDFKNKNFVT